MSSVRSKQPGPHSSKEGTAWKGLPGRMVLGATAGIGASFFCHWLDVVRIQMQVGGKNYSGTLECARAIYSRGGIPAMYSGITAAWFRQVTYGAGRLGLYSYLIKTYDSDTFAKKLAIGSVAGACGAFVGTPAELSMVRMGADSKLPVAQQRKYKHVVDCVLRVAAEDGVVGLWKGALPTVLRAAALNAGQLGVYSQAKEQLSESLGWDKKSLTVMFMGSMCSSVVANTVAMPFDVIKSRIQQMKQNEYAGPLDCARKSIQAEGPLVLWRGFTPAFLKLAPFTVISLVFLEKLTELATGESAM